MKFLADECCDTDLVTALRADGHDVLYASETLRGTDDEALLAQAFVDERLLLTEDKDFGELVYRLRKPTRGIILLRFSIANRSQKVVRLRYLLRNSADRLFGAFVVLEVDKTRIRPLQQ